MTAIVISLIIVTQSSHDASNLDPMSQEIFVTFWFCRQVSIVDCSNGVFSSINRLRWTVKIMLSLLSNFWSRTIRTKAQLPWLSTRTTLFMCSWLLAHRRQTAKKKDHPNLLPVFGSRAGTTNRIGFGWLRSPISINQESEDNTELLPLYHVPCVTLCTLSLSCQTTLTKRQKKKIVRCQCTTKLIQASSFSESHTSHGRARHQIRDWSESERSRELLTPGTSDSCRPRGVVTRDFSAIFDRLFDRLPVRISTSDLHHWILRKKIFHIRAYDFGVQFSFNWKSNRLILVGLGPICRKQCLMWKHHRLWKQHPLSHSERGSNKKQMTMPSVRKAYSSYSWWFIFLKEIYGRSLWTDKTSWKMQMKVRLGTRGNEEKGACYAVIPET